jgi:putative phosphoesterase
MRIAAFSDIHGNTVALDAVLADVTGLGGADAYWVLGDLAAIGADPVGVLERLAGLPNSVFVQGNTDRYLLTGARPYPSMDDTKANLSLLPRLIEVAHSFAWTQGAITAAGWFDWMDDVPLEQRLSLPNGTRVLLTHVAPGVNDGPGIHPAHSDDDLRHMLANCGADLLLVGHTHWPLERHVEGVHLVNVGSVGLPWSTDPRASYVLIDADDSGYRVIMRRVEYDRVAAIEAVGRSCAPQSTTSIGRATSFARNKTSGPRAPTTTNATTMRRFAICSWGLSDRTVRAGAARACSTPTTTCGWRRSGTSWVPTACWSSMGPFCSGRNYARIGTT